jgi:hypothetical protein
MDDVELNGGIFNAMGLNNKTKSAEPKMAARSGIVVPPQLDKLPQPGEQQEVVAADVAALDDPDKRAEITQAQLELQQAEFCKKNYEQAKAHGDSTTADLATGPLGPCRGSILKTMDVKIGGQ